MKQLFVLFLEKDKPNKNFGAEIHSATFYCDISLSNWITSVRKKIICENLLWSHFWAMIFRLWNLTRGHWAGNGAPKITNNSVMNIGFQEIRLRWFTTAKFPFFEPFCCRLIWYCLTDQIDLFLKVIYGCGGKWKTMIKRCKVFEDSLNNRVHLKGIESKLSNIIFRCLLYVGFTRKCVIIYILQRA